MADRIPAEFVPLHTGAMHDPKIVEAGPWVELLYYRALQWAKTHPETGGFIPSWAMAEIGRDVRSATRRMHEGCSSDLFVIHEDGWRICAWDTWNTSSDEIREKRSKAAHFSNHKQGYHKNNPNPDCPRCPRGVSHVRHTCGKCDNHTCDRTCDRKTTLEVEMCTTYTSTPLPPSAAEAAQGSGGVATDDDWHFGQFQPTDYRYDPDEPWHGGWKGGAWVKPTPWRDGWTSDGTRPPRTRAAS